MPLFEPSQHPHGMSRPRIDPMLCTALRCLETSVTSLPIGMSLRALQASLAPSILSPHLATFPSRPGTRPAPESARTQDRRMDSGGTHERCCVTRYGAGQHRHAAPTPSPPQPRSSRRVRRTIPRAPGATHGVPAFTTCFQTRCAATCAESVCKPAGVVPHDVDFSGRVLAGATHATALRNVY